MDYDMPVMNGVEATERIKELVQDGEMIDLPVIAVSAYVATQQIERCLNSGMCDYVSKPFTYIRLLQVLLRWLKYKRKLIHAKK